MARPNLLTTGLLDVGRVAAGSGAGDGYAGVDGDHLGEDVEDGLGITR